jgi:hypothetical protein
MTADRDDRIVTTMGATMMPIAEVTQMPGGAVDGPSGVFPG